MKLTENMNKIWVRLDNESEYNEAVFKITRVAWKDFAWRSIGLLIFVYWFDDGWDKLKLIIKLSEHEAEDDDYENLDQHPNDSNQSGEKGLQMQAWARIPKLTSRRKQSGQEGVQGAAIPNNLSGLRSR